VRRRAAIHEGAGGRALYGNAMPPPSLNINNTETTTATATV